MHKKDAMQKLAYFESRFFKDYLKAFDTSILKIPYRDLIADSLLGENKQIFRTLDNSDHKLYLLMDWRSKLQELRKCIEIICRSNDWLGEWKRFSHILDGLPQECKEYLVKQYIWI